MTAIAAKQRAELEANYLRAYDRAKKAYYILEIAIYELPAPGSDGLNESHITAMNSLATEFLHILSK